MGKPRAELVNQRFGRLVVIEFAEMSNHNESTWLCRCDCGEEIVVSVGGLRGGNTKSCGCYHREQASKACLKYTNSNDAGIARILKRYKSSAKRRNLIFDLEEPKFKILVSSNCYYCGGQPNNILSSSTGRAEGFIYSGIDRMDNSLGYTTTNCVSCCTRCNLAKRTATFEEFEIWINQLIKFRTKQKESR